MESEIEKVHELHEKMSERRVAFANSIKAKVAFMVAVAIICATAFNFIVIIPWKVGFVHDFTAISCHDRSGNIRLLSASG